MGTGGGHQGHRACSRASPRRQAAQARARIVGGTHSWAGGGGAPRDGGRPGPFSTRSAPVVAAEGAATPPASAWWGRWARGGTTAPCSARVEPDLPRDGADRVRREWRPGGGRGRDGTAGGPQHHVAAPRPCPGVERLGGAHREPCREASLVAPGPCRARARPPDVLLGPPVGGVESGGRAVRGRGAARRPRAAAGADQPGSPRARGRRPRATSRLSRRCRRATRGVSDRADHRRFAAGCLGEACASRRAPWAPSSPRQTPDLSALPDRHAGWAAAPACPSRRRRHRRP